MVAPTHDRSDRSCIRSAYEVHHANVAVENNWFAGITNQPIRLGGDFMKVNTSGLQIVNRLVKGGNARVHDLLAVGRGDSRMQVFGPPQPHQIRGGMVVRGMDDGLIYFQACGQGAPNLNDIVLKKADRIQGDDTDSSPAILNDSSDGPK